ncbi:MAG: acetate kinase [Clostridiales bacterium]|nr:acetate kinase [Clostridiales bacterium]
MKILVINAGSSSLKYQLIDMADESVLARGVCERIGEGGRIRHVAADDTITRIEVDMPTHTDAFKEVQKILTSGETKVIEDMSEISAVGHRIVQGGALFKESVLVDEEVIEGIRSLIDLAPLHNHAHIQGILACREVFGPEVPEVVVFDTSFHSTMPPKAYMFPIPYEYYEKYKIRRYGFHGTSHRYVSARCAELMGRDSQEGLKLITCHLGNGCSLAAIKDGKVIDTTMGLTPLDGFMMGTRTGTLDPSVVTYIAEKEGLSPKELDTLFNKKSGTLGISGISSDNRDLEIAEDEGNERAKLAQEMQRYQILKFVGSFIAALNGVDAIVFTGGIGENSDRHRSAISNGLAYMGVKIDENVNQNVHKGAEAELSTPDSKVKVYVIPTNEEIVIARDTKAIVDAMGK